MSAAFPRPSAPLGDAWFMAGAPRVDARAAPNLGWLSYWDVRDALYDIASGAGRVGRRRLWADWFHFLLADEIPGAVFGSVLSPLVEALATCFFALYPFGPEGGPYDGFFRDSLATLGRVVMSPEGWSGGEIRRGALLRRNWRLWRGWGWDEPGGDLSASMFFCLKYLPLAEIRPWLRSAFVIDDPHWRAQLVVWFIGAHELLTGAISQPAEFSIGARPAVFWTDSNLLTGVHAGAANGRAPPFLAKARRRAALDAVAAFFDETSFADWSSGLRQHNELAISLGGLPRRFGELYLYVEA